MDAKLSFVGRCLGNVLLNALAQKNRAWIAPEYTAKSRAPGAW